MFRDEIQSFAQEFDQARQGPHLIAEPLKEAINSVQGALHSLVGSKPFHKVKCSVGAGNWAKIAWISVLDTRVTRTTQEKFYVSGLFSNDLTKIYFGLGLGVTAYKGPGGRKTLDEHVLALRSFLRGIVPDDPEMIWDGALDLGADGTLPSGYKRATVFTKAFDLSNFPDDQALLEHLNIIINAHDQSIFRLNELQETAASSGGLEVAEPTLVYGGGGDEDEYLLWDEALEIELLTVWGYKRNLIIQGPPGVGKTFWSKEIANRANEADAHGRLDGLIGMNPPSSKVFRCQFHQSFSYEDFVEGFRPTASGGFELVQGVFSKAVEFAHANPDEYVVVVIDEINRGNVSKIFGELLSLIESDKRSEEWAVSLPYSGNLFWIPSNVFILGMMNTADRSISLVDYALRRRFGFVTASPGFRKPQFRALLDRNGVSVEFADVIVDRLESLNYKIRNSPQLGAGFEIGHSYFISGGPIADVEDWFKSVINYEIKPLLHEYWYDDPATADELVKGLLA